MPDGLDNSSRSTIGRPLGVFRHRPFLIFWIGACISNTGNWTENAAQSWAVTSQTISNPHQGLLVETLQFADFCPVLLLALLAGVISDRVNKKIWLITLQALACVLGAGLAVTAFLGRATPWVVIAFTFLEGIIWALNGPVFLSVVPSLVPREELSPALALNSVQFNMARLCGPMLAAALIGAFGVAGAFTFNACTFLPLLIALLFAIPNAPAPSRPTNLSIYDDIREGLKFVWTSPGTRRLTIMGVVFMFLAAPLQGLLPVFAQSVLKGGPGLFGLMLSAITAVMVMICAGCARPLKHSAYRDIHAAARDGDVTQVAADLAQSPGDLNLPDDAGLTPLQLAASSCHTNVVALLLDKGASIDLTEKDGATPLHFAAQEGCLDAVRLLLDRGANVNARDKQGRTPLTRSAQWHQDAVGVLLRTRGGSK